MNVIRFGSRCISINIYLVGKSKQIFGSAESGNRCRIGTVFCIFCVCDKFIQSVGCDWFDFGITGMVVIVRYIVLAVAVVYAEEFCIWRHCDTVNCTVGMSADFFGDISLRCTDMSRAVSVKELNVHIVKDITTAWFVRFVFGMAGSTVVDDIDSSVVGSIVINGWRWSRLVFGSHVKYIGCHRAVSFTVITAEDIVSATSNILSCRYFGAWRTVCKDNPTVNAVIIFGYAEFIDCIAVVVGVGCGSRWTCSRSCHSTGPSLVCTVSITVEVRIYFIATCKRAWCISEEYKVSVRHRL